MHCRSTILLWTAMLLLAAFGCQRERDNPLDPGGTSYTGPRARITYPGDGDTLWSNSITCQWQGNVAQCEYSYTLQYADSFAVHQTVAWSPWSMDDWVTVQYLDEEVYTLAVKARLLNGDQQDSPTLVTFVVDAFPDSALLIKPCSTSAAVGQVFPVLITAEGIVDLMAGEIAVSYPQALLEIVSDGVRPGAFLNKDGREVVFLSEVDSSLGILTMDFGIAGGPIPGITGSGTLATIMFRAKSFGFGEVSIAWYDLRDVYNQPIDLIYVREGTVSVQLFLGSGQ